MNAPFDPKAAQPFLCDPSAPNELRRVAIWQKFVVHYPAFTQIADELCDIVNLVGAEPQHVAVHACSRNGATWLAKHLRERFPVKLDIMGDAAEQPVAYVALPAQSSVHYFAMKVLDELKEPYNPRSSKAHLASSAYACLKNLGTKAIIIDRASRLDDGYAGEVKAMKNVVTEIAEECGLSVFMFGDEDAVDLHSHSSKAISNLFEVRGLPIWQADVTFQHLLKSYEQRFPLRERSDMAGNTELVDVVLKRTGGILDHIGQLLRKSAIYAIQSGREKIDMTTLDGCGWIAPSHRREEARRLIGVADGRSQNKKPRKGRK